MTIETKKAANVKEALEILNSLLPNGSFTYAAENYSDDYKVTNRHFAGTAENGATCYGLIENIVDGNLVSVRFVNIYREIAVDIVIENFTRGELAIVDNNDSATNEMKIAKFEEGKTYFTTWEEDTGRPHMSRYTIKKRTAKTVVINNFRSKIHFCDWANCEMAKIGYGSYILAKDLFTEDTIKAQAESDAAWDEIEADASRRMAELKAAKAEREQILSTPLVTVTAQEVATNAEIELANSTLELKTGEHLKSLEEMAKAFAEHCARTDELLRRADIKCKARALEDKISNAKCLLKNVNLANVTDPELLKMANDALSDMENAKIELAAIKTNNPDIFNAGKKPATAYQPQTQWENPHDFTITGDLSDRNINGRIIAAYIDREQQLELADMKADGVQFLLKVITPQLHSFRKFDFCICTNTYKSFDALKQLGANHILDHLWRIETIDGKLLAKGAGIADFDTFCNEKNVNQHDDFRSKLAELQANVADAKAVRDFKQTAFNQAQKEFDEANDAVFNAQYAIIQLGDAKAKELQNSLLDGSEHIEIHFSPINRKFVIYEIHGMDVPKELATCATPELVIDAVNQIKHVDNFSLDDFEEHLLALQKEQEDAYPDEVKEINRELAQSNLEAPHMLLKIYNKDFHTGSFCGVKLNKLHVKSFVTDKIHFNICYATEPLECYDTFEEVTDAINHFKDAIMHGATKFKFPTSDELNPPTTSASKMTVEELQKAFWSGHLPPAFETTIRAALKKATDDKRARLKKSGRTRCRLVVPQVNAILAKLLESGELNQAEQPQEPTRKQINDSLIRAMETNLKNIQAHCRNLDFNAAVDELNLYHICNNALLKKEVA